MNNVHHLRPPVPRSDYLKYPEKQKETQRPFRLWDHSGKRNVAHRCYATDRRAHDTALQLARWDLKVGQSIEVYDVRNARWLGTYTRRVDSIQFDKA